MTNTTRFAIARVIAVAVIAALAPTTVAQRLIDFQFSSSEMLGPNSMGLQQYKDSAGGYVGVVGSNVVPTSIGGDDGIVVGLAANQRLDMVTQPEWRGGGPWSIGVRFQYGSAGATRHLFGNSADGGTAPGTGALRCWREGPGTIRIDGTGFPSGAPGSPVIAIPGVGPGTHWYLFFESFVDSNGVPRFRWSTFNAATSTLIATATTALTAPLDLGALLPTGLAIGGYGSLSSFQGSITYFQMSTLGADLDDKQRDSGNSLIFSVPSVFLSAGTAESDAFAHRNTIYDRGDYRLEFAFERNPSGAGSPPLPVALIVGSTVQGTPAVDLPFPGACHASFPAIIGNGIAPVSGLDAFFVTGTVFAITLPSASAGLVTGAFQGLYLDPTLLGLPYGMTDTYDWFFAPEIVTTYPVIGDDASIEHVLSSGATICYGGIQYTSLFIGSNGQVTFGTGSNDFEPSITRFMSGFNVGAPGVAVLWGDYNNGADPAGTIRVIETGSGAPEDLVCVEYLGQHWWNSGNPAGDFKATFRTGTCSAPIAIDLSGAMNRQAGLDPNPICGVSVGSTMWNAMTVSPASVDLSDFVNSAGVVPVSPASVFQVFEPSVLTVFPPIINDLHPDFATIEFLDLGNYIWLIFSSI